MKTRLLATIRAVPISGRTYEEYVEAVADRLLAEENIGRGHWVEDNKRPRSSQFRCSVCGGLAYFVQPTRSDTWKKCCPYRYCPNCGARMEKEND